MNRSRIISPITTINRSKNSRSRRPGVTASDPVPANPAGNKLLHPQLLHPQQSVLLHFTGMEQEVLPEPPDIRIIKCFMAHVRSRLADLVADSCLEGGIF